MKLSKVILEENCGCGQTPCKTYGVTEELNVARKKLQKMVLDQGKDSVMDMILNIQDENVLDELVDELQRQYYD